MKQLSESNFLIAGAGSIGRRHISNLKNSGCKNIFCLRRVKDAVFDVENETTTLTNWEEANKFNFSAIFVCTPTSLHHDAINFAVQKQCAVFVEKPLIHDLIILNKIRNSWPGDQVFFIGFMLRFHPLVKVIKAKIDTNEIGRIYSARFEFGSYLPYWHPWEDYRKGYAARKDLGGGVITTITHELDLMLHFFGFPIGVMAASKNLGLLEIDVEELCETIFQYTWGMATIHLDYLQKDYDRQIRILGTEGKITWNWYENRVIIARHKKDPEVIELKSFDVNQLYIDELQYFLQLLEKKQKEHPLDFNYALRNTEWMLKIHEATLKNDLWVK